jgi:CelD/BcsL family acetyltransferase involved in cellulose biosynthesis
VPGTLAGVDPRFIPLGEVDNSILVPWRALAGRAVEPNPFFEPEFLLPQAAAMDQTAEIELLALVDAEGEWRACVPLYRPSRWHRIPIRGVAPWRGHEHYALLGTPLIDRADPTAIVDEVIEAILARTPRLGCSVLDWLTDPERKGSIGATVHADSPHPLEFERFERALVRRRPEGDYEELTLSSKRRRELRRQRRKLGEELGGEPKTIDRGDDPAAAADFIALEMRAGSANRYRLIGEDPRHQSFFEEVCAGFAAAGRLQMLELRCGGQTVAAKCNLRAGSTVFMVKIAYDARFSNLSPGVLLELDTLKFFHERTDAQLMDSCAAPDNWMINNLLPDRRTIVSYAFPRPGVGGRAAMAGVAAARHLRNRKAERARKEKERDQAA